MSKLVKVLLAMTLAAAVLLVAGRSLAEGGKKAPAPAAAPPKARVVEIAVTEKGYEPSPIKVKKGEPLELVVTRKTEKTCAKEIILDEGGINVELPLDKPVHVAFTPKESGTIKYGCSMGKMLSGKLIVE